MKWGCTLSCRAWDAMMQEDRTNLGGIDLCLCCDVLYLDNIVKSV